MPRVDLHALRRDCARTVEFLDLLTAVARRHGATPEAVWSQDRTQPATYARAEVWHTLRERGWGWALLARVFERDITTVREAALGHMGIKRERVRAPAQRGPQTSEQTSEQTHAQPGGSAPSGLQASPHGGLSHTSAGQDHPVGVDHA